MTEQLKERRNTIFYTAHLNAEAKDGTGSSEVTLVLSAGNWYGMGGWSCPSWEYTTGRGIEFATLEAAKEYVSGLPRAGYGFKAYEDANPYFIEWRRVTELFEGKTIYDEE